MFTFLNGAMTGATQRFLNFAMGQNDKEQTRNVFSISFIIHVIMAVLLIILAETVGLWFFYSFFNIPPERQSAAFIVYQFSIATTAINIILVPYRATIIAYEKMSFFALLSIIEVLLKLGVVFLLAVILFDKLVIYGLLTFAVSILILLVYKFYCNKSFETARFRYCNDKKLLKQLVEFSGWTTFGSFANVSRNHGTDILINIFYGVAVNAAIGIAKQVNSAVNSFVSNFQTAFRPQITKSYASQDYDYFMRLIFQTSKISFYLLFFLALPLYINAEFVLKLWLKNVPEYTVIFVKLILLGSLLDAISSPFVTSVEATGDIRKFQIINSIFSFSNLPFSLLFLWLGFSPAWVLIIKLSLGIFFNAWLIFFIKGKISLPIRNLFSEVIIPIIIIAFFSSLAVSFIDRLFFDFVGLLLSCIVSTICIGSLAYWIGLNKAERIFIKNWIKERKKIVS